MDGINNLFDRDASNFSAALAGKYDLGKKSCRKISKKIKIKIDLPKPKIIPPILSRFAKIDLSVSEGFPRLKNVIINEKNVREITNDSTKEMIIVRGQLPKKSSSRKGVFTKNGTKLGARFRDKIADISHAAMVKHSLKNPLK